MPIINHPPMRVTDRCRLCRNGHRSLSRLSWTSRHCVDTDNEKIEVLRRGECPIYEPHLDELFARGGDRIDFTSELSSPVVESDVIFIAVGTPRSRGASQTWNISNLPPALSALRWTTRVSAS